MTTDPFPADTGAHRVLAAIRSALPEPGLQPTSNGLPSIEEELGRLGDESLLGRPVRDQAMAAAVRSGLLLRADRLDASHRISQRIETPTGSYWHGIMHRREGDFWNSKYWFRRVGAHPVFASLARAVSGRRIEGCRDVLAGGSWDPFALVDRCEEAAGGGEASPLGAALREIQQIEMLCLLEHSWREAVGA